MQTFRDFFLQKQNLKKSNFQTTAVSVPYEPAVDSMNTTPLPSEYQQVEDEYMKTSGSQS